jgi:hypothetical protein
MLTTKGIGGLHKRFWLTLFWNVIEIVIHHKLNISWFSDGNCVKFVHSYFVCFMHWYHALKNIWHSTFLKNTKIMWHSFIHRFVLHSSTIYSCVKCVLNAWYSCVKMYEPMNEQTSHALIICRMLNLWWTFMLCMTSFHTNLIST